MAGGRDRGKNCRQSPARDAGSSGLAGDRGYEHLKMSNWARRRGEDSPVSARCSCAVEAAPSAAAAAHQWRKAGESCQLMSAAPSPG